MGRALGKRVASTAHAVETEPRCGGRPYPKARDTAADLMSPLEPRHAQLDEPAVRHTPATCVATRSGPGATLFIAGRRSHTVRNESDADALAHVVFSPGGARLLTGGSDRGVLPGRRGALERRPNRGTRGRRGAGSGAWRRDDRSRTGLDRDVRGRPGHGGRGGRARTRLTTPPPASARQRAAQPSSSRRKTSVNVPGLEGAVSSLRSAPRAGDCTENRPWNMAFRAYHQVGERLPLRAMECVRARHR
jgi:hypothetical protein